MGSVAYTLAGGSWYNAGVTSKVIWTDHATERAQKRGISKQSAEAAVNDPDSILPNPASKDGSKKFIKSIGGVKITVIALVVGKRTVLKTVWSGT